MQAGIERALLNMQRQFKKHGQIPPSSTEESTTKHVLLVTSWRSGSTFLGELLSNTPGAFYTYEPLVYYDKVPSERGETLYPRASMVSDLFSCEFKQMLMNVAKERKNAYIWRKNPSLVAACKGFQSFCTNATFVNSICQLQPLRIVKTVRFRLAEARALLSLKRRGYKLNT